jgi:hypothetical protein
MKLTILERGNYYCYIDNDYELDKWKYSCVLIGGGWFGKSAYSANRAEIRNRENEIVAHITFHVRFFRPHIFKIELWENPNKIELNAKFKRKLAYCPFDFEMNQMLYRFEAYRGHYRILYENDIQVASFDKKTVSFFNRDTFISYAENHLSEPLIFALSVFDDIWENDNDSTITVDIGDIGEKKPPDKKLWRPK